MKLYFDSSYLFRVYSCEPGHEAVKELLVRCTGLFSAWHARAEFAAIVLRKQREGRDSPEDLFELHEQFLDECRSGQVQLLPLTENVFQAIESALRSAPGTTFLRAADAMHLACAAQHGFTEVYSNDRHFLAAAPLFGLTGINFLGKDDPQ